MLAEVIFWVNAFFAAACVVLTIWNWRMARKWQRLHHIYIYLCMSAWSQRLWATRLVVPGSITIEGTKLTYEEKL